MSTLPLPMWTIWGAASTAKRARKLLSYRMKAYCRCLLSPQRRSGNYGPSPWKDDLIHSLRSTYGHGSENIEEIKHDVKQLMVEACQEPVAQLELVDSLQRLGVSYQFEKEIKAVLDSIFIDNKEYEDLHAAALRFRMLRQHGYHAFPDVFKTFMDEKGRFKNIFAQDVKGLLSLYEASHLGFEGENILEEAMNFAAHHLEESTKVLNIDSILARQVAHALELPLSRRMLRSEARNYIDVYERMPGHHSSLLKLAKLDFNNVQSLYQAEVKEMLRWWRGLEFAENLKFSRDRLMENYVWTIGANFNPLFSVCRKGLTKLNCLITTIDDVYDVYGTIDELELFTKAVDRWDIGYIDKLPQYMRMCFLALYNTTNQFAYEFMGDEGLNILGYLTRAWADLCKAYLVEAWWFYNGYAPTVEEYLDNAWISVAGPLVLVHAYFFVQHDMKEDAVVDLHHFSNLIKMSSRIVRLHNDVATSKDEIQRGDMPKCIQCYMREKGVSEEAARQYVDGLLRNAWKELHKECTEATSNGTNHPLVHCALNLARMAQFTYQHGDGHGFSGRDYPAERILRLMVESV
ncbi:Alpha-terpineol synthase [Nymphaea thermarum]|nr:Alpha-terpineol synthase [Nymphaea thermarum]